MYNVIITYRNGENITFRAREFDVDFRHTQAQPLARLNKYMYIDAEGNETPI